MEDELNESQIENALSFYNENKDVLKSRAAVAGNRYPPTDLVEKDNPVIWKPNHWKWFIRKYVRNIEKKSFRRQFRKYKNNLEPKCFFCKFVKSNLIIIN